MVSFQVSLADCDAYLNGFLIDPNNFKDLPNEQRVDVIDRVNSLVNFYTQCKEISLSKKYDKLSALERRFKRFDSSMTRHEKVVNNLARGIKNTAEKIQLAIQISSVAMKNTENSAIMPLLLPMIEFRFHKFNQELNLRSLFSTEELEALWKQGRDQVTNDLIPLFPADDETNLGIINSYIQDCQRKIHEESRDEG